MKIKEVQAGVKIVKNYNSYSVNLVADVDEGESAQVVADKLINESKKIIDERMIQKESGKDLVEVGAAWPSKKLPGFLSVQFSKSGKYEDMKEDSFEEADGEYIMKKNGENFIFRKVPPKERTNGRMPVFRVYAEAKK